MYMTKKLYDSFEDDFYNPKVPYLKKKEMLLHIILTYIFLFKLTRKIKDFYFRKEINDLLLTPMSQMIKEKQVSLDLYFLNIFKSNFLYELKGSQKCREFVDMLDNNSKYIIMHIFL
ncbi:hypothetical protein AB834_06320 [PVC group bacterium (ex Bugula neritina AB1)]|nr:hypothetical protein AB834_06320 [PVC group bacterium (ex Bugula neritina AB1)]